MAYVDLLDREPSQREVASRIRTLYEGNATTPGIVSRFAEALGKAALSSQVPRFLQIAQVTVSEESRKVGSVTVNAKGTGASAAEAVDEAMRLAFKQVNGTTIDISSEQLKPTLS